MFAELRPNMARYSSSEEVNAALVELEEHERTASSERQSGEKRSDSEFQKHRSQTPTTTATIAANGSGVNGGAEENGRGHDEAPDSESYSDSGSIDQEGHEDEDLLSDDKTDDGSDGDDEDDGGPAGGSDEDDSVQVRQKIVEIDPREEEEFDREFRALMQESLDSRKLELRARPTLNMMIPMNVFEGSTKDVRPIDGESGEETVDEEGGSGSGGGNRVKVKVLVKKGSKQQTKQMYIPRECSLVQSTKQKDAAELEEMQSIKRRILEYNEREEEESNGISLPAGNWLQPGVGSSSSGGSGSRPVERGNWDGSGRGGVRHHRLHSAGGFYHGYARRR
ncbi:putative regulator of nonsense transcripts UPF2 [Iris pallida]|nr:putative regulator of nonsense transcripts UPF2 [Iris pallida]